MSNSYASTPTLPLPQDALAAEPIRERLVRDTGRLLNWAWAHSGTTLGSLEWPDGGLVNGATERNLYLALPVLSSEHMTLAFEARLSSSDAAGSGFVQVVVGGLSGQVDAPAAADGFQTLSDTVDITLAAFDGGGALEPAIFARVVISNGGAGAVTVESIRFWYEAPASPLAADTYDDGTDDDLVAQGADSLLAEEARASVRARDAAAMVRHLQRRPVMRFMLSGVRATGGGPTVQWTHFPARRIYSFARWSPQARRRLLDWTCWAYCTPDTADDTEVWVNIYTPDPDRPGELLGAKYGPVTVAADAAATPVWVEVSAAGGLNAAESPPIEAMGHHGGLVGFHAGPREGQSTASIIAASVWGPP